MHACSEQAPGGTGKIFVFQALVDMLRGRGEIVLAVASSGLAALLLPSGRTVHSQFRIPIDTKEGSFCFIKQLDDARFELLKRISLIIYDEAPCHERVIFECLDRSFCSLMHKSKTNFGGIPLIFWW